MGAPFRAPNLPSAPLLGADLEPGARSPGRSSRNCALRREQNPMAMRGGIIGVSDHGGWAVLVTAAAGGTLLDRRRVELVDDALPAIPHHHEAQMLPENDAVALIERVRRSAERHAALAFDAVADAVPAIGGIALRKCPPLPPTIVERIKDVRARNVADWVMYRNALAQAAEQRGWPVYWYDAKTISDAARRALRIESFESYFTNMRKTVGPPWNNDHRLAYAAAIVAPAFLECSPVH